MSGAVESVMLTAPGVVNYRVYGGPIRSSDRLPRKPRPSQDSHVRYFRKHCHLPQEKHR